MGGIAKGIGDTVGGTVAKTPTTTAVPGSSVVSDKLNPTCNCCCSEVAMVAIAQITAMAKMSTDVVVAAMLQMSKKSKKQKKKLNS